MKRSNKHNLPQTVVNAIEKKEAAYNAGEVDSSVTSLIQPARITLLRKKHYKELERDVSEEIFSLLGTAVHNILELGRTPDMVVEERLFMEIDGWGISGAIDVQQVRLNSISVFDYKVTSVFSVISGEPKKEWVQQLNLYRMLIQFNKPEMSVDKLTIVAILRDWSSTQAIGSETYPQSPIIQIDIPVWDMEETLDYARSRIAAHRNAHFDDQMGEDVEWCTPDDRWVRGSKWAVVKIGAKKALKVFTDEQDAINLVQEKGDEFIVEHRPGSSTRCRFCGVSQFCNQYQTTIKEPLNDDHPVQN